MTLYLQRDVRLVADGMRLGLEREGVPAVFHVLGVAEAVALACLAATGSEEEATRICMECLPNGGTWVRRVVDRYWTYLGDGSPQRLDLEWIRRAVGARPQFHILQQSNIRREAAPAAVTWMVTLGCNRHCPYCFFDVFDFSVDSPDPPPDATFAFSDACRMVREMAMIGAADLYLTGGEPLLRRDLVDIIKEASRVRVRAHLVTKYPITPNLARRLADAGLAEVTVSLDDARAREAAVLAGARGYLEEARTALTSLLEAGIRPEVNAVVTRWNADRLGELARWLIDLGVPALKISRFQTPYPRKLPVNRLATDAPVASLLKELRESFGDRIAIKADISSMTDGAPEAACGDYAVCEVGTRALHVLPDGSVTRCRYLPSRPELIAGSLGSSTLLEIWNGRALHALTRPLRKAYQGEACHDCDSFEGCHSRGRCYVSSLMSGNKLFAPDSFCTAQR